MKTLPMTTLLATCVLSLPAHAGVPSKNLLEICDRNKNNSIDPKETACETSATANLTKAKQLNEQHGAVQVPRFYATEHTVLDMDKTGVQNCDANNDGKINSRKDVFAGLLSKGELRSEIYCSSDFMVAEQDRENAEGMKRNAEGMKRNAEGMKRNAELDRENAETLKRIETLKKENAQLDKENAQLDKENAQLDKENAQLDKENKALEEVLSIFQGVSK